MCGDGKQRQGTQKLFNYHFTVFKSFFVHNAKCGKVGSKMAAMI